MQYRRVGKSGLMVSAMGIGCNPFGIEVDLPTSKAIVHRAIDHGITYFDTADSYSRGTSEDYLGQALEGRRQNVIIATKVGNPMGDGPNERGASRSHIIASCEASLRRLRTDYIDIYQIHEPDRQTPIEETMAALDMLVRQGKVRYLGASNFYEWEVCEAQWTADRNGLTPFILCQDFYNLLYRDIEKRMEPFCVRYGLGMVSYFPLAGALLSGAYTRGAAIETDNKRQARPTFKAWDSERNWTVQEQLARFADSRGWTLPQMALAWLLTRPMTSSLIAGVDRVAHLDANMKALDVKFTADDLTEIDRITLVDEDRTRAPIYRMRKR